MPAITRAVAQNVSYRLTHDTAHWPPPPDDESPTDTATRAEMEKKAKAISDEIDKMLAMEKQKRKKKKEAVRILLLGACYATDLFIPFAEGSALWRALRPGRVGQVHNVEEFPAAVRASRLLCRRGELAHRHLPQPCPLRQLHPRPSKQPPRHASSASDSRRLSW